MVTAADRLAERIVNAHAVGEVLAAPPDHGLDAVTAYRVQALVVAARHRTPRVGWKLGYTSQAMRAQMGVAEPNFGPLHASMVLPTGSVISGGVVQPRVEPELAAVIGRHVRAGDDPSGCVRQWRAALEIVDSVWADYRFDWALNTADGSSAAFVVLGPTVDLRPGRTLADVPVVLDVDGVQVETGSGAAAMGDPHEALRWLVDRLAARGQSLGEGDLVITGGLTKAVVFAPGATVRARVGSVAVEVTRALRRGADA